MKLRDSGMPAESLWESMFDVERIVSALGIDSTLSDVAEFGCGYGTFTVPVARVVTGTVYAFDIDPAMIERTEQRSKSAGLTNVVCRHRDAAEQGFGMPAGAVDAALLFNILHCENPLQLLSHTVDAVQTGGVVLVIHWRFDSSTPRGPSLDIRPKPEQIVQWTQQTGKLSLVGETLDLPLWHYGLRFTRR